MERGNEAQEAERTEMREDTGHVVEGEAEGDAEDRCAEDVTKKSRAPDGGWGWMVALGTLIVSMMLFSMPFSFGILYSGYLLSAGTSATTTAWIYNMFLVLLHTSMVFTNALGQEFGRRTVGFISIFMCSLSTVLSAFSPSVYFLYFSYSVMAGVGAGLGLGTSYIVLPPYFDKNNGKANTFLVSGGPFSQMVFAPLLRYLLDLYSYRGAALIYSGIILNSLIGVSFFHPVKWHLKSPSGATFQSQQDATEALMPPAKDLSQAKETTFEAPHKDLPLQVRPATPMKQSLRRLQRPTYGSVASIISVASTDVPTGLAALSVEKEEPTSHTEPGCAKSLCRTLGRVAANTKSDLMVMRHLRAVIVASTIMITQSTHFNFVMLLPFVVRAADHRLQDAAWCIFLAGVANIVMRLVLSPLADQKWFSIRCSLMTGYCLKAVAVTVVSCTSELWLFAAAALMFGVGLAASVTMLNLSIIKYMGMEWFSQTFGFAGLMTSLGFLVIGPLLGVIRDLTSSYAVSLWVMAALDLMSAGLWLLMPAAQARDAKKEDTRISAAL